MKLLLHAAPKWPKSFSQTFLSVFEKFGRFRQTLWRHLVIELKSLQTVESSFLSVKNSENRIKIDPQPVTLYVVERPDLFTAHP